MPTDKNVKLLIVEDMPDMRKLIRHILRKLGYLNVLEAEDGLTALEILKNESIDLVVSDWAMPRMTGLDLLNVMKSTKGMRDIPFIMITGLAEQRHISKAMKSGVKYYIVKPFTEETLGKRIELCLESKNSKPGV